jgi:hypothetical protein
MQGAIIGINPTEVTAATAVPAFKLGTRGGCDTSDGYKEFIYGRANGAITAAGYVCLEQTGGDWVMASTTTSAPGASGPGTRVGVAQATLADNEYGWFQIYGKASVRTLASAEKGTQLNTTATAGALDDDATSGSEVISGVVLLTATGGAEATNPDAMLTYPSVLQTLLGVE